MQPSAMSKQASGLVLMTPKLTNAEAKASMKPLTDWVATLGNIALNNEVDQASSFLDAYNRFLVPSACRSALLGLTLADEELVGLGTTIASRFVPKDNFATNSSQAQLLDAFMKGMDAAGTNVLSTNSIGLVYGGAPTQILVTAPTNYPGGYDGTHSATPRWYNTGPSLQSSLSSTVQSGMCSMRRLSRTRPRPATLRRSGRKRLPQRSSSVTCVIVGKDSALT